MKSNKWYSPYGDLIHQEIYEDGSVLTFNPQLLQDINITKHGKQAWEQSAKSPIEHELTGKQIKSKYSGKVYNIESVFQNFHFGSYKTILIENNGSHTNLIIECDEHIGFHDLFHDSVQEFKHDWILL